MWYASRKLNIDRLKSFTCEIKEKFGMEDCLLVGGKVELIRFSYDLPLQSVLSVL